MRSYSKLPTVLSLLLVLLAGCNGDQNSARISSIVVQATAENFNWYFRYPGADGVLGTDDDQHSVRHLYLPDHSAVTVKLVSKDYLYSFALPELELKEIAVPDLDFQLQFNVGAEQTLRLLGDQFCGYAHKNLIGEVRIRNQDKGFYGWDETALRKIKINSRN